jgi:hypothetical protein
LRKKYLKGPRQAIAALGLFAISLATAAADTQVIPGPYSSWTDAQQTQAAQLLKAGSEAACQQYISNASSSQRSAYEAAACLGAYYVNHLPPDYPNLNSMKKNALDAYNNAQALGSNAPAFLKSPPR